MIRTQVQLTEDHMRVLKRLAAERGVSVATLIREGVDFLIRTAGVGDKERRERALAAAGRFHSGYSDLAAEHDRHLAQAYRA
jgi:hypothetical protein